ncbi:MAG: hypothetical protein ACYCW6_01340 [Candidatus Xenobia bacterium]
MLLLAGCSRTGPAAGHHPTGNVKAGIEQVVRTYYTALQGGTMAQAARCLAAPPPRPVLERDVAWMERALARDNATAMSDLRTCSDQIQAIGSAVQQWREDGDDHYPPSRLSELIPDYFKTLPVCPLSHQPYRYQVSMSSGRFTVSCPGAHHLACGVQPEYTSHYGICWVRSAVPHAKVAHWSIQDVTVDGNSATVQVQEDSQRSTLTLKAVNGGWLIQAPLPQRPAGAGMSTWADAVVKGAGLGQAFALSVQLAPLVEQEQSASRELLSQCGENLELMASALEAWASDHHGNYPERLSQLVPKYLRQLPQCPVDETDYREGYRLQDGGYVLCCPGDRHAGCHVAQGCPRVDDERGLDLLGTVPHTTNTAAR